MNFTAGAAAVVAEKTMTSVKSTAEWAAHAGEVGHVSAKTEEAAVAMMAAAAVEVAAAAVVVAAVVVANDRAPANVAANVLVTVLAGQAAINDLLMTSNYLVHTLDYMNEKDQYMKKNHLLFLEFS